jgi:nitroreductase
MTMTTRSEIIEAIRGESGRSTAPGGAAALGYVLEAARWAPTGFNVQPFELVLHDREGGTAIVVLEDRGRPDPDPGPCEALARGAVLQNIRLAARALGTPCVLRPPAGGEEETRAALSIPATHSIVAIGRLPDLTLRDVVQ